MKNMKCNICGEEGEILIVPPDGSAHYGLECLVGKCSSLKDGGVVIVKIQEWLEQLGHKINSKPDSEKPEMDIGKVIKVETNVPKPPKGLKK